MSILIRIMQMELLLPHRQVLPVTAFHVEDLLYLQCGDDADDTDRSAYIEYPQYYFPEEDVITVELGEGRRQVQGTGACFF